MSSSKESMTKALVVDEDLICLHVASKLFEKFNCKVVAFQSAAEAFYALQGSKDEEYSLALIEVHVGSTGFASLTGFDLLDHIHKDKNFPVFTMCAHNERELLSECVQKKGASFHISKPLTVESIKIVHQKVLEKKEKRYVGEASSHRGLPSNEKSTSEIVHIDSDNEELHANGRRKKRVRSNPHELPSNKNSGGIGAQNQGPTTDDVIIANVVNQTSSNLQENQPAEKKNGKAILQGSSSQLPSLSCIMLNPHFHYNFPKKAFAPTPPGLVSSPSMFVVNGNTNASRQVHSYPQYPYVTTAPCLVPPYPRYPFVGLRIEPDGKLCGLPWKNIGQARALHFVEDSGSLKQKFINAIDGNEEEPVGDDLMTLSRNNFDAHDQSVQFENPIPDAPVVDNLEGNVSGCSGKEPEIAVGTSLSDVLQNFDTPVGDYLGGDMPAGCSSKEPEIAVGTSLSDVLQNFDTPVGDYLGGDMPAGCSSKEPEIAVGTDLPDLLQNFDTPVGGNLGEDVPGFSDIQPEVADDSNLSEFLQDFNIENFVFDESLLNFEF